MIVLEVGYHAEDGDFFGKMPDPLFLLHMFFYPVVPVEVPSVGIDFYGRGYDFFRCNNIFVLLKFFIRVILERNSQYIISVLDLVEN